MKKLIVLVLMMLVAAPAFAGDVYVKINAHTDAMAVMGQSTPASDEISEQWFSATKAAQNSKSTGFIVDLEKQLAYMINHADKSYVELPMPIDLVKVLPPEAQAMAPMMQMSATVAETTETKTIGGWACQGYDVTITVMGMQMKQRIWASTAVPGDLASFASKLMPAFLQGTMRLNEASVAEFAKIKGFQVATDLTGDVMGAKIHSTTEAVEIVEKAAPAGVYEVPAGYTKKATLSLQDLQRK